MAGRSQSQPPGGKKKVMTRKKTKAIHIDIDPNFRPIKILVFQNGNINDNGTEILVTRHQFKHWLVFLDFVGQRIQSEFAIHFLYTTRGREIRHFNDLKDGRKYVAVSDKFKRLSYGTKTDRDTVGSQFKVPGNSLPTEDPRGLLSQESYNIYLQQKGYVGKSENDKLKLPKIQHESRSPRRKTKPKKSKSLPRTFYGLPKPESEPINFKAPRKSRRKSKKRSPKPVAQKSPKPNSIGDRSSDSGNFSEIQSGKTSSNVSSSNTTSLVTNSSKKSVESRSSLKLIGSQRKKSETLSERSKSLNSRKSRTSGTDLSRAESEDSATYAGSPSESKIIGKTATANGSKAPSTAKSGKAMVNNALIAEIPQRLRLASIHTVDLIDRFEENQRTF